MEMTRKIIAIIITVMVGVRMLQTPNQTWLDVISDWTWSLCGLVLLLLLMYEVPNFTGIPRVASTAGVSKSERTRLLARSTKCEGCLPPLSSRRLTTTRTIGSSSPPSASSGRGVGVRLMRCYGWRIVGFCRPGSRSLWSSNSAGSTEVNRRDSDKPLIPPDSE